MTEGTWTGKYPTDVANLITQAAMDDDKFDSPEDSFEDYTDARGRTSRRSKESPENFLAEAEANI